ncbi:MAG TPA: hypothetical protein VFP91_15100, partial [Vicinamibacterales bacterium]|nr:hypothetical protein [Vicinamibacterales bacterium]
MTTLIDRLRVAALCGGAVLLAAVHTHAQVVNPATQPLPADGAQKPADTHHTWELPAIDVYGKEPLREDDRIGDYKQPRWTADRLFGETRVYVIPKGKVEAEYWLIPETPRDGQTDTASQYEIEFGLPGRFQIDLYAVGHKTGIDGQFGVTESKAELRWAFADWGKIPGNPTLYVEWKNENNAPDHFEGKLLLGGQITSGWHWGSNFVWEHTMGGDQENSNEWTVGLSRTVRDSKFDLGLETQLALVDALTGHGGRSPFEKQFLIGPSMQLRPLPQMHIDFAPLIGVTDAAPRTKIIAVLGWEF